jgi:hypothetical protein
VSARSTGRYWAKLGRGEENLKRNCFSFSLKIINDISLEIARELFKALKIMKNFV